MPSHPASPQIKVPVVTPATAAKAAMRLPESADRATTKKLGPGVATAMAQIPATVRRYMHLAFQAIGSLGS